MNQSLQNQQQIPQQSVQNNNQQQKQNTFDSLFQKIDYLQIEGLFGRSKSVLFYVFGLIGSVTLFACLILLLIPQNDLTLQNNSQVLHANNLWIYYDKQKELKKHNLVVHINGRFSLPLQLQSNENSDLATKILLGFQGEEDEEGIPITSSYYSASIEKSQILLQNNFPNNNNDDDQNIYNFNDLHKNLQYPHTPTIQKQKTQSFEQQQLLQEETCFQITSTKVDSRQQEEEEQNQKDQKSPSQIVDLNKAQQQQQLHKKKQAFSKNNYVHFSNSQTHINTSLQQQQQQSLLLKYLNSNNNTINQFQRCQRSSKDGNTQSYYKQQQNNKKINVDQNFALYPDQVLTLPFNSMIELDICLDLQSCKKMCRENKGELKNNNSCTAEFSINEICLVINLDNQTVIGGCYKNNQQYKIQFKEQVKHIKFNVREQSDPVLTALNLSSNYKPYVVKSTPEQKLSRTLLLFGAFTVLTLSSIILIFKFKGMQLFLNNGSLGVANQANSSSTSNPVLNNFIISNNNNQQQNSHNQTVAGVQISLENLEYDNDISFSN